MIVVIAAVTRDAGWRQHVVIERGVLRVGRSADNDLVLDVPDQLVDDDVKLADATVVLERYADPVEARLIQACKRDDDASRVVYADWLEQHGLADRAAYLRAQIEILQRAPGDPDFARLHDQLRGLGEVLPYGWHAHLERPVIHIGDPQTLAFRLGLGGGSLRTVQIWAAGIELTCDDDLVHVGQFVTSVKHERGHVTLPYDKPFPELSPEDTHRRLEVEDMRERYWWMRWGPTTDNTSAYLYWQGDGVVLTFAFWRETHPRPDELGRVFVVRLPELELVERLQQLVDALTAG